MIATNPCFALAEDGYAGGIGETPVPINGTEVVLKAEVVSAILHDSFAEVECVYLLKNEGNARSITMGFPDIFGGNGQNKGLSAFRAFVDEIEVPVTETTATIKLNQPGYKTHGADSSWFTHSVSFKKNESKIVVNRYLAPHGGTVSPATSFMTHFRYSLGTGALWKKSINRADIFVSFAGGLKAGNLKPLIAGYDEISYARTDIANLITPTGYRKDDNGVSWSFTDFEPKRGSNDISITFFRNLTASGTYAMKATAGSWVDNTIGKFHPVYAIDGNIETAWASASNKPKPGDNIDVTFTHPKSVAEIRILPGYPSDVTRYKMHGRPKSITARFSDGTSKRLQLTDSQEVQYFTLDDTITASRAKLTVNDTYPGTVDNNVFISEIEFAPSRTVKGISPRDRLETISAAMLAADNKRGAPGAGAGTQQQDEGATKNATPSTTSTPDKTAFKISPVSVIAVAIGIMAVMLGLALLARLDRRRRGDTC